MATRPLRSGPASWRLSRGCAPHGLRTADRRPQCERWSGAERHAVAAVGRVSFQARRGALPRGAKATTTQTSAVALVSVQLKRWRDETCRELAQTCVVTLLSGRKRWLPAARSRDTRTRTGEKRKAVLTICQGSAADLARLAMLRVDHALSDAAIGSQDASVVLMARALRAAGRNVSAAPPGMCRSHASCSTRLAVPGLGCRGGHRRASSQQLSLRPSRRCGGGLSGIALRSRAVASAARADP